MTSPGARANRHTSNVAANNDSDTAEAVLRKLHRMAVRQVENPKTFQVGEIADSADAILEATERKGRGDDVGCRELDSLSLAHQLQQRLEVLDDELRTVKHNLHSQFREAELELETRAQEELESMRLGRAEQCRVTEAQLSQFTQMREAQAAAEENLRQEFDAERLSLKCEIEQVEISAEYRTREELQAVHAKLHSRSEEDLQALNLKLACRSEELAEMHMQADIVAIRAHEELQGAEAELRHRLEEEHRARTLEISCLSEAMQKQAQAEALAAAEIQAQETRLRSARCYQSGLEVELRSLKVELQEAATRSRTQHEELQSLRHRAVKSACSMGKRETAGAHGSSQSTLRQKLAQATFSRNRPLASILRVFEEELQSSAPPTLFASSDQAPETHRGLVTSWLACCSSMELPSKPPSIHSRSDRCRHAE